MNLSAVAPISGNSSDIPEKPSIAIIAHNAYGTLANIDKGHIGGIEVQTPLMAKWLVRNGYRVSLVCWNEGQTDGSVINGISIRNLCRKSDGLPILRFLTPRWTSLSKALTRANPDIVYYNCGDLGLGQVCLWAGKNGKKVVYSVANDPDCKKELPALKPFRERLLYRYGLKKVDHIVAQTKTQRDLLKSDFNREATLIPMPCAGFPSTRSEYQKPARPKLLWVGRFTQQKRLDWLLELARQMPHCDFQVIGSDNENSESSKNLLSQAKALPNVHLLGRIPHGEMGQYYNEADLLVCTSAWEGFPNVFLEAWSTGLPIVTSFDPDGVVEAHDLGISVKNLEAFPEAIERAIEPSRWVRHSGSARRYHEKFHTLEQSMKSFSQLFDQLHSV